MNLASAGFSTCFVAVSEDDHPRYIQWLIRPQENELLQQAFHGLFPQLAPDECLLEGAYTPESFRGQRIMPAAMAQIAELAAERGACRVVTFVGEKNIPSLKGCHRAGFAPYLRRHADWRLGKCRIILEPLPHGTPFSF